jgi:hypothetical protein
METMGRFVADPKVRSGLDEIELEPGEVDHAVQPGELIVSDWLTRRRIAPAWVQGTFADVAASASLTYLNSQVATRLSDLGIEEVDGAAVRSGRRRLTQRISRIVFQCSTSDGRREFDGIRYLSRYGDEFENWAIFEPGAIDPEQPMEIDAGDPDLIEAGRRLGITLL